MNLTDLEPRWIGAGPDHPGVHIGITFLCPCCKRQRLGVYFDNAAGCEDALQAAEMEELETLWPKDRLKWQRSGESFSDLTLTPSVDASGAGHWHGWIRNGNAA